MNLLEHIDNADMIVVDGSVFRANEFHVGDFRGGGALPCSLHGLRAIDIFFFAKNKEMESWMTYEAVINKTFYHEDAHEWETPCGRISTYVNSTRGK